MIKQIYVDMDGVLSDFLKRYKELFSASPERDYPKDSAEKRTYQRNWRKFIEGDNFATLEAMPDLKEGLKYLKELQDDGMEIMILSSTANQEFLQEISRQKYEWLQNHDINYHPIFVPGKALKRHYSGKDKILIDDTPINIEQWEQEGGIGIRHKNWNDTIKKLNKLLNKE